MRLSETFEERLGWIDLQTASQLREGAPYTLEEASDPKDKKAKKFKMRLTFLNTAGMDFILVRENNTNTRYPLLKCQNRADGTILTRDQAHSCRLHFIELKHTMNEKKWTLAKEQLGGALLESLALLGILGVDPGTLQSVNCYCYYVDGPGGDTDLAEDQAERCLDDAQAMTSWTPAWEKELRSEEISLHSVRGIPFEARRFGPPSPTPVNQDIPEYDANFELG